jgi:hypothetical protein
MYRRLQFHERSQLFISSHNVTPCVAALLRVCNEKS